MCIQAQVQHVSGEWRGFGCLRLARAVGLHPIVGIDYDDDTTDDECFCSVDIEGIVERSCLSYRTELGDVTITEPVDFDLVEFDRLDRELRRR